MPSEDVRSGCAGDFWTITHRPHTSTQFEKTIQPWSLASESGDLPHGPQRYVAPLALIEWEAGALKRVIDCRDRFAPLTCQTHDRCCEVVVDPTGRYADECRGIFATIQEAIDALPTATGGVVCLLPGEYCENVCLDGRNDITIRGVGKHSVIKAPPNNATSDDEYDPVILLDAATNIAIENLAIRAEGVIGIRSQGASQAVSLRELSIHSSTSGELSPKSAVDIKDPITGFVLEKSRLSMADTLSLYPIVYATGTDLRIEGNRMDSLPPVGPPSYRAYGGLQIGSGSTQVVIRDNLILGGLGHGITLGDVMYSDTPTNKIVPIGCALMEMGEGLPQLSLQPLLPFGPSFPAITGGALSDVRIEANRIEQTGGSGISVAAFWPGVLGDAGFNLPATAITITGFCARNNNIVNGLRRAPLPILDDVPDVGGAGGIALAASDDTLIEENQIQNMGLGQMTPTCGIFVLRGTGHEVNGNQIKGNGKPIPPPERAEAVQGQRGGVVLYYVEDAATNVMGATVRIEGNSIESPEGPALKMYQLSGTTQINGNSFSSRGDNRPLFQARRCGL